MSLPGRLHGSYFFSPTPSPPKRLDWASGISTALTAVPTPRLTTAQVSQLFEDIAVDQEGKFDCGSVVQMLLEGPEDTQIAGSNSPVKHGADDKQGSTDK